MLQSWLMQDKRGLTPLQIAVLVGSASAAQDGATALVLQLGYCTSKHWTSFYLPPSISTSPCIPAALNELFLMLESAFPEQLVANVLGAMSVAHAGLARAEIMDIASMDDNLMKILFKWAVPPFARVPPGAVSNLLNAVESLLEERLVPGCAPVMQWTHSSLRRHCKTRYDSAAMRRRMHRYFSGSAGLLFKPLTMKCRGITAMLSSDRQISAMPNSFWLGDGKSKVNLRKMIELPALMEGLHLWDDMVIFYCDFVVFETMSSPAYVTRYAAAWQAIATKGGDTKGPEIIWEGMRGMIEKIADYKQRASAAHRVAKFVRTELGMLELSLRFLESSLHALVHEGTADLEIADTLEEIATVHYKAGDYEAAIAKLDEVVAIRAKEYNPEHSKLTDPLKLSGQVMVSAGNIEDAMRRYNDVLRRLRGLESAEYRLLVADITTRVAEIHKNLGERDRAIARHEEALRIRKAVLDPDHVDVAINVNALAILYEKRGDLNNALSRFAEALQI